MYVYIDFTEGVTQNSNSCRYTPSSASLPRLWDIGVQRFTRCFGDISGDNWEGESAPTPLLQNRETGSHRPPLVTSEVRQAAPGWTVKLRDLL